MINNQFLGYFRDNEYSRSQSIFHVQHRRFQVFS